MDSLITFSIIIPTFNHAQFLPKCLSSLIEQRYTNWEAIVVNNFSTDATREVIARFNDSRIKVIDFANDGIIARARNVGVKASRGEWICFLDSDDYWKEDKLGSLLIYLADSDVLFHDLQIFNSQGLARRILKGRHLENPVFQDLLINGNCISNSSVTVRKSLLQKVNGLSEAANLATFEDFDLWLRLARHQARFQYLPVTLGYYWTGGGNASGVTQKRTQFLKEFYLKEIEILPQEKRKLALSFFHYKMGACYSRLKLNDEACTHFIDCIRFWRFRISIKALARLLYLLFKTKSRL